MLCFSCLVWGIVSRVFFFFFNDTATTEIYTLSLHDALQISTLMADGRTGILVGIPLEATDRWDAFVASHPEFAASDRQHTVDIVPGRDLERALQQYRLAED